MRERRPLESLLRREVDGEDKILGPFSSFSYSMDQDLDNFVKEFEVPGVIADQSVVFIDLLQQIHLLFVKLLMNLNPFLTNAKKIRKILQRQKIKK